MVSGLAMKKLSSTYKQSASARELAERRETVSGRSVAPRIYASPTVDDPKNPQAKPVYNIIFYGSVQSFGDRSNGAMPKPK